MFKDEAQPSFSDIWYRVAPTRPRLSAHARVTRQTFGTHTVHIVEDPAAGQYYRLSESAYFFLGMLDGACTVDDAWESCNVQLGDNSPTQRECVELLGRLQRYGLLVGEQPLAADMVKYRLDESARARLKRRTGRLFSITIPLLNPERALERMAPLLRAIFSGWGFALWLILIVVALWNVLLRWRELGGQFNNILDPANLILLTIGFILLRAWHELGHAAACKAMGGRCTQIGIMFVLLVLPLPYCDTSSAWRFPEVWKRVVVSSGGMIFELFAAAIAALVWAHTEPGTLKTLAYNTMVISGVATLVFNANPLLRYDGYYILSDVTGTPNLAQRAQEFWRYLLERYAFGLRTLRAPALRGRAEAWLLGSYWLLSFPYRIFIMISLLLLVAPQYITLGAVLAVVAATVWIVWPTLKSIAYLAGEPRLMGRRSRALAVSAGALGALVILVAIVPLPAAGYGSGVVESADKGAVRNEADGFIEEVLVSVGQHVNRGDPLLRLRNQEIDAQVARARGALEEALAEYDGAAAKEAHEREVALRAVEKARAELGRAEDTAAALVVRAPVGGRVSPATGSALDLANVVGQFVQRGSLIAFVESTDRLIVKAMVSDLDQAYVFRGRGRTEAGPAPDVTGITASVRVRGQAGTKIPARITRTAPAGTRLLHSQALATSAGGDVLLDPTDPQQQRTIVAQFLVEVEPEPTTVHLAPGQRAKVRLGIAPEPLLEQVWRRIQQYFTSRRAA